MAGSFNEDTIVVVGMHFKQLQIDPKKCRKFNGIQTHGLCVSAAMLCQLSYKDPYIVGSRPICWVHLNSYPGYQRFFSRAAGIFGVGRMKANISSFDITNAASLFTNLNWIVLLKFSNQSGINRFKTEPFHSGGAPLGWWSVSLFPYIVSHLD